jgi:hypothetical protein
MDYIDFARRLLREIDERTAQLDDAILSGVPKDLVVYREMIGERRGLMEARALCTAGLTLADKRELVQFPN